MTRACLTADAFPTSIAIRIRYHRAMSIELRAARRRELRHVYDLLARAFPDAPRKTFVAQTEHDSTYRRRHARVAVEDGRVLAYVRIFARTMLVRGEPVAAGGIGWVATHPDARGRGLATALMRDAIDVMRREDMRLSFLFTGIPAFYERLGYRIVPQHQLQADAAEAASVIPSSRHRLRRMFRRDVPALLEIYRTATAGTTGAVVRTERTWRDAQRWIAEDREGCFIALERRCPIAYVRSRCRPWGHEIIEMEFHPGHEDAATTLLRAVGWRASHHDEPLVALVSPPHPLAEALQSLQSTRETAPSNPIMVLPLDGGIGDAFEAPPRFWNTGRI